MCRFFAQFADRPLSVEKLLVDDPHSLRKQSCGDLRGESHGDGWGIGYYRDGRPNVVRRPVAAGEDDEFLTAARQVRSPIVIAHVRQASVGTRSVENTHPFHHGRWLFAHNGTVTGFDQVVGFVRREVISELAQHVQGSTDSELVFYWLLSQIREAGLDQAATPARLGELAGLVGDSIRRLASWCAEADPSETCRLNFLLTDGRQLVASRFRHSLHWRVEESESGRLALIASEPIGAGDWHEVPDETVLTVDSDIRLQHFKLKTQN
ncbi:MAG: class II glutamine amidotransferase [Pirellulales bacterium]